MSAEWPLFGGAFYRYFFYHDCRPDRDLVIKMTIDHVNDDDDMLDAGAAAELLNLLKSWLAPPWETTALHILLIMLGFSATQTHCSTNYCTGLYSEEHILLQCTVQCTL